MYTHIDHFHRFGPLFVALLLPAAQATYITRAPPHPDVTSPTQGLLSTMTASDIGKIACTVAVVELISCVLSRKFIFQSRSYKKTIEAFDRAKARRDKTSASLAGKREARENKDHKAHHQTSQKSVDKEAKKLERENNELAAYAAEVARRHTMSAFYSSVVFLILYRVLSTEYSGKVVALLPFEPFDLMKRITFRGLSTNTVAEVNDNWIKLGGGADPDVTNASQACNFSFVYLLCSVSIKFMVNKAFGTTPPPGADDGVGTLIDAPMNKKMMESFGMDAAEVKEARKAFGL